MHFLCRPLPTILWLLDSLGHARALTVTVVVAADLNLAFAHVFAQHKIQEDRCLLASLSFIHEYACVFLYGSNIARELITYGIKLDRFLRKQHRDGFYHKQKLIDRQE